MATNQHEREGPDRELLDRIHAIQEEGKRLWSHFDDEVRGERWHPFVPADYESVLHALISLRARGRRFLEWGSATGVVTIMADLLGFDAYGVEIDATLVRIARDLARRADSEATFAQGSFLPAGYEWTSPYEDRRMGTIAAGAPAYTDLEHPLETFDVVFAYPWSGEERMMKDLMRERGAPDAVLLLHDGRDVELLRVEAPGRLDEEEVPGSER